MSDIVEQAKAVLARRWEQPGPGYREYVPTGVVELGDWASEHLPELIDEVERLRAAEWTARAERDSMRRRLEMLHADESWWIGGAWGNYGEAVIPLRAVSMVLGDRDGNVPEADPGFACAWRDLRAAVEKQAAEVERLRPRRIESVAELDALPVGTVVRDAGGWVWELTPSEWWGIGYGADQMKSSNINLPALLIWEPEAQ